MGPGAFERGREGKEGREEGEAEDAAKAVEGAVEDEVAGTVDVGGFDRAGRVGRVGRVGEAGEAEAAIAIGSCTFSSTSLLFFASLCDSLIFLTIDNDFLRDFFGTGGALSLSLAVVVAVVSVVVPA